MTREICPGERSGNARWRSAFWSRPPAKPSRPPSKRSHASSGRSRWCTPTRRAGTSAASALGCGSPFRPTWRCSLSVRDPCEPRCPRRERAAWRGVCRHPPDSPRRPMAQDQLRHRQPERQPLRGAHSHGRDHPADAGAQCARLRDRRVRSRAPRAGRAVAAAWLKYTLLRRPAQEVWAPKGKCVVHAEGSRRGSELHSVALTPWPLSRRERGEETQLEGGRV